MTLQQAYNHVRFNPGQTANHMNRTSHRRWPVGVPYAKYARLFALGYIDPECPTPHKTTWTITNKRSIYRHGGAIVVDPS